MRRRSWLTTLGILAVSATAYATPRKVREVWASGSLERSDATSIVVKQGTHEMTFTLAPGAHLMQGKETLQPSALSGDVGRPVRVRYTVDGTVKLADRVEVAEAKAVHPSKAPARH